MMRMRYYEVIRMMVMDGCQTLFTDVPFLFFAFLSLSTCLSNTLYESFLVSDVTHSLSCQPCYLEFAETE